MQRRRRSEMQETHHEIEMEMTTQEQEIQHQLEMTVQEQDRTEQYKRELKMLRETSEKSKRVRRRSYIAKPSRLARESKAPETPTSRPELQMLFTGETQPSSNVEETNLASMHWLPRRNLIVCALIAGPLLCALLAFIPFLKPFFTSLLPGCRCGSAQDTFRTPHHVSINNNPRRQFGFGNYSNKPTIESTKILGFVGVLTSFSSVDRRAALRSTWFPSNPDDLRSFEQATGLVLRFVIGRSKDAKKMADLEKEIKRYRDFLLIDVEEESVNMPNKTLASFKAAYDHFEADYYVKADDYIYLRPDRLSIVLAKERTDPMTYIGCMKGEPLISGPEMKWSWKSGQPIGYDYFVYGYSSIYVLSEEIVATLAVVRTNRFRMFSNEDISVGTWMLAMNVNHEDNRALCHRKCKPTTIAVWDFPGCSGLCYPVNGLKQLHKISMCSRSPTLPSD